MRKSFVYQKLFSPSIITDNEWAAGWHYMGNRALYKIQISFKPTIDFKLYTSETSYRYEASFVQTIRFIDAIDKL